MAELAASAWAAPEASRSPAAVSVVSAEPVAPVCAAPPPLVPPHEEGSALDQELSLIDSEIAHLQQALEAATQQTQTASAKAG